MQSVAGESSMESTCSPDTDVALGSGADERARKKGMRGAAKGMRGAAKKGGGRDGSIGVGSW